MCVKISWWCFLWLGICLGVSATEPVVPGIADFERYRSLLEGKKVALAANQTSVMVGEAAVSGTFSEPLLHSVDFLRRQGVELVKIFCPEHGFRGIADAGEKIGDYLDKATGLPVISLYGKKKKPSPEDLQGIDIVIFDMQDVGVRFYTYLSTLHYLMEACAEQSIPLIVADRPNPNAFYVDGPVLEPAFSSFVGMHPVPIVYGMTIGEYARMIDGEGWLGKGVHCDLTVVPCKNWDRDRPVRLPRAPSPNLPDEISVLLYPSVCLFEGTVVNEGRGTYTPFQVFGHPDLKQMPYRYVPESIEGMSKNPKCLGKKCYGMDLRDRYEEVRAGKKIRLDWLLTAFRNYTGEVSFFTPFFDKLAGTAALREAIVAGKGETEIRASWQKELKRFEGIRKKYLIYK